MNAERERFREVEAGGESVVVRPKLLVRLAVAKWYTSYWVNGASAWTKSLVASDQ
jgi:hypothetical protein